ncbi:hypothetical protein ACJJIX_19305 [Microbulbifer sp. VAAC004]|uniref:hypothetical protein n=1 Tax=unclassified Microbulbifer TaxID=2619833 RepID=UPI004039E47A
MKKLLSILMLSSISGVAFADVSTGVITDIIAWPHVSEVVVRLDNPSSECPGGYWFEGRDKVGSAILVSTALAAKHAKNSVTIHADENSDWNGISSKLCELNALISE